MYPDWLKVQKQAMVNSGKERQFLPWITGGTYGEMSSSAVLDGTLHSFGVGATGFAFFSAADFDDGPFLFLLKDVHVMKTAAGGGAAAAASVINFDWN